MFDPDALRARFRELTEKSQAIRAVSVPLRERRDAMVADHEAKMAPLQREIREIEAPLFDVEQERAMIARALNGKTG